MKIFWTILLCSILFFSGCATIKSQQIIRQEYVNAHPKLSEKFKQAILKGALIIGMSKSDVIAIMGEEPSNDGKHITVTQYGIHEQWVYDFLIGQPTYYIYFDNDKLTAIQKN